MHGQAGGFSQLLMRGSNDAYTGNLQIGGGIDDTNASEWLSYGASKVGASEYYWLSEA